MVQRQCITMTQWHRKSRCHEIMPSMKMRNQDSRHQAMYLVCPPRGSWPKLQSKVMTMAQTWHQIRHTKTRQKHNLAKLRDYVSKMWTSIIRSSVFIVRLGSTFSFLFEKSKLEPVTKIRKWPRTWPELMGTGYKTSDRFSNGLWPVQTRTGCWLQWGDFNWPNNNNTQSQPDHHHLSPLLTHLLSGPPFISKLWVG